MGDEDQSRGDAQQQRRDVGSPASHEPSSRPARLQRLANFDRLVAPIAIFVCVYVAITLALGLMRLPFGYAGYLFAVVSATAFTIAVWERGRWDLGLLTRPKVALRESTIGVLLGTLLIGLCAVLVVLTTDVHHARGRGFPWGELLAVFLPAVLHEELLFRGYPFQKLYRWRPSFAILFVALLFAALHARNPGVTALGLVNVVLGGVLLGLAYARHQRLWLPIGLHLAWNLMSGPIIGHEVSGYESAQTVFVELGSGPEWLTGGEFGIEGSAWMTLVELIGIGWLGVEYHRRARGFHPGANQKE